MLYIIPKAIRMVTMSVVSLISCYGMEEIKISECSDSFFKKFSIDCLKLTIEEMVNEPEIAISDFVSFSSTCVTIRSNDTIQTTLNLFLQSTQNKKIMADRLNQMTNGRGFMSKCFFSLDFSNMKLLKQDLRTLFPSADTKSLCSYINFSKANLTCANLQGTALLGGNFEGAILKNADLSKTNLLNFHYEFGNWRNRQLGVSRTTFKNANVQGILLKDARIQKQNLEGTNFPIESFEEINLISEDYKHHVHLDVSAGWE